MLPGLLPVPPCFPSDLAYCPISVGRKIFRQYIHMHNKNIHISTCSPGEQVEMWMFSLCMSAHPNSFPSKQHNYGLEHSSSVGTGSFGCLASKCCFRHG